MVAIALFIVLIGPVGYTLTSSLTEPHLPNITPTGNSFTRELLNTSGDIPTLFFHNFSVDGSTADFGLSMSFGNGGFYSYGNIVTFQLFVTKVSQSIGFPYRGAFMLQIDNQNITTNITVNGTALYNPGDTYFGGTDYSSNSSLAAYYLSYTPNIPFTTVNRTFAQENGIDYASSYNFTLRLEVTPVLEFGPYHFTGSSQWISHSFQYPFVQAS